MTHVVVIGGGIAGLTAAHEVRASQPDDGALSVSLLEAARLGGKLASTTVAGRTVDVGPDGFLTRRPEAAALVTELGAAGLLEPIGARGAWVFTRGKLRRLPAGLAFGVPTRLRDLRTSEAIGILGVAGALRASLDVVAPRAARRGALSDRAIGPLVADKLGQRVVDALVDPLLGGTQAGRVKDLSAAAIYPPILEAGQGRGSLMRKLAAATSDAAAHADEPAFMTLRDGTASMCGLLETALRRANVSIATDATATSLRRGAPGQPRWVVETDSSVRAADAVILATPAAVTAGLLSPLDRDAAAMLAGIDTASVAVVTLVLAAADATLPEGGTGVLIPSGTPFGDQTHLVTAITFLDRKWPHLARDGEVLVRASVGRIDDRRFEALDDAALVERVGEELSEVLSFDVSPTSSTVTRWPDSFPQYRVNHLVRVDGIEAAAGALGGVAVAGASYRGVGIPACIASGRSAARATRTWLAAQS